METSKEKTEFDVVVIGCGLSGLTTAYELLKIDPTIKVCLLEAKGKTIQDFHIF